MKVTVKPDDGAMRVEVEPDDSPRIVPPGPWQQFSAPAAPR